MVAVCYWMLVSDRVAARSISVRQIFELALYVTLDLTFWFCFLVGVIYWLLLCCMGRVLRRHKLLRGTALQRSEVRALATVLMRPFLRCSRVT